MIRVEGYQNLYRDPSTGAIVNFDSVGYDQYVNSIIQREKQKKEIDEIKSDIDEIKQLLKEILNGSK